MNVAGTEVSGSWSETESRESSTSWRELRGVRLVPLSVAQKLSGKTVRHRTENILKVGSPCPKLHAEAVAIYTLCRQHSICLEQEWMPRELNTEADSLSRQVDCDDYMLNPDIFAVLDILWGPHTVDRFFTFKTCQVPRFCSRWLSPCAEGIDAFTLSWAGENNWIFPPPYLIPRALKHMDHGQEYGTLVILLWTSAPLWPLIANDGRHPESFVLDWMDIPQSGNMFIPAKPGACIFSGRPKYRALTLKACFTRPRLPEICRIPF